MVTVGLIKELFYIALVTDKKISVILQGSGPTYSLHLTLTPNGLLKVFYAEKFIWEENIEGEASFFGVESCDTISRIIACIDNNDESWVRYLTFPLDNSQRPT